jgi:precorrin-2 dehydrogenase/sirohydrochlorin ferrochelatase
MSYFPAFIKLDDINILIVGGGKIANEKLEKLLDFTKRIKVIAKELDSSMQKRIEEEHLDYSIKAYKEGDIDGFDIVIIAVDDLNLQKSIYQESRNSRILCNAVDSVDYCDFIFPSYIKEGDLTIAISTSGSSPAFAKHFKHYLQSLIPNNITPFLDELKKLRKTLPKGKERMKLLDNKAKEFFQKIKKA